MPGAIQGCFFVMLQPVVRIIGKNLMKMIVPLLLSTFLPVAAGNVVTADNSTEIKFDCDTTLLNEIVVKAQRQLITRQIDRIGYDVQADPEMQTSTLTDILRKVPMVSVDGEGNISVRNSTFKVYKNGKPNHSFTNNAKDIFAAIPASSVKRIEVITDPGAKEDAEGTGVILNIVTMDNRPIKGVLGTASLSMNSRIPLPLPRLWLTTQIGNVNLSLSGGYNHQTYHSNKSAETARGTYLTTGNTLSTEEMSRSMSDNGYANIEASYEPDTLNLFTAEFGINPYSGHGYGWQRTVMSDGTAPVYSYTQDYTRPVNRYTDISGVFNYQRSTRRPGETITLSYQVASTGQRSHMLTEYSPQVNMPVGYSGIDNSSKLNFIEHTAQLDWTRPFNPHHTLRLGGKYIFRQNHSISAIQYTGSHSTSNDFRHRTQVGAAYLDYRITYGSVNARAGLRYEYSRLDARFIDGSAPDFGSDLNDLVPNAALQWQINGQSNVRANFSTAIQRPGIAFLNPAVNESPYMVSKGNPDLESARVNTLNLNYNLSRNKIYLDASLTYVFANNQICDVRTIEGDVINLTYDNGDRQRMFYGNIYVQWSPGDKTQLTASLMGGMGRCYSPRTGAKVQRWVWKPSVYVSQRLPWKLRLGASCYYDDGYIYNVYQYIVPFGAARFYYSLSLQRQFLADNRLTVQLYANNLFLPSTQHSTIHSVNSDYVGTRNSYFFNRDYFGVNISLRFGSLKSEVKKTGHTISNDDLQGKRL